MRYILERVDRFLKLGTPIPVPQLIWGSPVYAPENYRPMLPPFSFPFSIPQFALACSLLLLASPLGRMPWGQFFYPSKAQASGFLPLLSSSLFPSPHVNIVIARLVWNPPASTTPGFCYLLILMADVIWHCGYGHRPQHLPTGIPRVILDFVGFPTNFRT